MTCNHPIIISLSLITLAVCFDLSAKQPPISTPIPDFPPIIYQTDTKEPGGVLGDLILHLLKETNLEATFPLVPVKRLVRMTQAGKTEMAILTKMIASEEHYFISPKPFVEFETKMYWLKENPPPPPLRELKQVKLGTLSGFQYGNLLEEIEARDSIKVESVRFSQLLLRSLLSRHVDYAICYKNMFETLNAYDPARISDKIINTNRLHLVVNRNIPNSKAVFDKLYQSFLDAEASGLKDRLIVKHMQPPEEL